MTERQINQTLTRAGYIFLTGNTGIWIGTNDANEDEEFVITDMDNNHLKNAYAYLTNQYRVRDINSISFWLRLGLSDTDAQTMIYEATARYNAKKNELEAEKRRRRLR